MSLIKSLGWALIHYDWHPYEEIWTRTQREDHVGRDGSLQAKESGRRSNLLYPDLDLGLPAREL